MRFATLSAIRCKLKAFYDCSSLSAVTIGNNVTSIGEWAFAYCSSLTEITIPNSVTTIGEYAFYHCSNLNSVNLPDNITAINKSTFDNCYNLTAITIPNSVTIIDNKAFFGCSNLTSVTIGNSVTTIGDNAFAHCRGINSLTLPNSVTSIGSYAFWDCSSLIKITIPNSVTTIGDNAFEECTSLTEITIPNSVTSIGSYAFLRCSSLTSITIPNSVTTIANGVFCDCSNLSDITCLSTTPPTIDDPSAYGYPAFYQVDKTIPLYVPAESVEAYKAAEYWKEFTNIQALYTITVNAGANGIVSGGNLYIPNSDATLTATPNTGYQFSQWNDGNTDNPRIVTVTENATYTATFEPIKYILAYIVDGDTISNDSVAYGTLLTAKAEPTKEGHTFSGWSEVPATMPANDVTISGTFSINSYTLTYTVDGVETSTESVAYGTPLTAKAEPTKEGHTFSGWSEVPATMPANDVTISGTFSINSYTLTYTVDGVETSTESVAYGTPLTAKAEPTKEGHTFSGWSEVPATMPAHDVTISGTFSVNSYTLTYTVDGVVTSTESVAYGTPLTAKAEPAKEGHTFSGWSEVPATMPANDVTISGTFSVNSYTLTYTVDGVITSTESIAYGTPLTAKVEPTKEGHTFSGWSEVPATMPAHDVTISGTFSVNSYTLTYTVDGVVTSTETVAYGTPLTAKAEPTKEGHTFSGWSEVPATMPAHDVTISGTFAAIHVSEITLNANSLDLSVNTTYSLSVTITPADALNQNVSWSSDNEAVATIADGVVTALSNGTATITVTAIDGGITATCEVTVTTPVSSVQFAVEGKQLNMKVGELTYLEVVVLPETASNKNVTYTSSNESCVFVDNGELTQGYLIAKTAGVSTVTVTTEDGGLTASIAVIVSNDTETNLEEVSSNGTPTTRKVLHNGTIYIIKPNGETFTIDGRKVN